MSAIPPIEPARPSHLVRRENDRREQDARQQQPQPHDPPPEEQAEDDGLPHVDVRV